MPQDFVTQNAFNAGELSPLLLGRTDLPAYAAGLRRLSNFLALRPGGIERRYGAQHIANFADSSLTGRLVSFRFSETDSFILLWTAGAMRVFFDDGLVVHDTHRVQTQQEVNVARDEFTVESHGFPDGFSYVQFAAVDAGVLPTGLVAATDYRIALPKTFTLDSASKVSASTDRLTLGLDHELVDEMGPFVLETTGNMPGNLVSGATYYVRDVNSTSVRLASSRTGSAINISSSGTGQLTLRPTAEYKRSVFRVRSPASGSIIDVTAIGSGTFDVVPTANTPYEIDFPYDEDQLFEIQVAQDKDVMFLAHRDHPLRRLIRYGAAAWELEDFETLDGPYLNIGEYLPGKTIDGLTLNPAAATGNNVSVTASEAIFKGSDVGRVMRIGDDASSAEWGWARIVGVQGVLFTDSDVNDATLTSEDAGADTLEFGTAAFVDGEGPVRFTGDDPTDYGLDPNVNYWLHLISGSTYSVHLSQADALADSSRVNITSDSGALVCTSAYVTITAHGLLDGEGPIVLTTSGSLPSGLSQNTQYWLRVIDTDTLAFSLSLGGPLVPILAADGSGTHAINGGTAASTSVLVNIQSDFPAVAAQESFRLGAFSSDPELGYPGAVTLHEQRLVLSGSKGTPQTIYASQTGDQPNFAPDEKDPDGAALERLITAASAYTFRLNSEDSNEIFWLRPARILLAAGLGGIHHLSGTTISEAVDPGNVNAKRGTSVGAINAPPMVFQSAVVFVDETGRVLQRAEFRPDLEAIETTDLMALADHLLPKKTDRIVQIARSESPLPIIWVLSNRGELLSLTLDTQQRVAAWARHPLGGYWSEDRPGPFEESKTIDRNGYDFTANTMAFLPPKSGEQWFTTGDRIRFYSGTNTYPAGITPYDDFWIRHISTFVFAIYTSRADALADRNRYPLSTGHGSGSLIALATSDPIVESVATLPDAQGGQAWLAVRRSVNGSTVRSVERFSDRFGLEDEQELYFGLDGGPAIYDGAEVAAGGTFTAAHLPNEKLSVVADGGTHPDVITDSNGQFTLDRAASRVVVGYGFTADAELLPIEVDPRSGESLRGRQIRRIESEVLVSRALGLEAGRDISSLKPLELRRVTDLMDTAVPLFSGTLRTKGTGGYDRPYGMLIRSRFGLPAQILAVTTRVEFAQR